MIPLSGMEFSIQKYGMLVFKKGKVIKSQGIKLDDGEVIKEIRAESYIFELVKLKKKTHTHKTWKKPSKKNVKEELVLFYSRN